MLFLTQQQIAKSKLNCLETLNKLTKYDLLKVQLHQYHVSGFLSILHFEILQNIKISF